MRITLTETEKQIVTELNHSMVTVEFLEEWINRQETNVDGQNPYGAEMVALAKGYYTAVQRLAALRTGPRPVDLDKSYKYFVSFWYMDGLARPRYGNKTYVLHEPMDEKAIRSIEDDIKRRNPTWMYMSLLNIVQI